MKRYVIGPSVTEMAILACMVIAIFCLGAAGTYASASTFTPVKGLALLEPVEPDQHEQIVRVHPLKKDPVLQGISTVNNQPVPSMADRLYFWSAGDTPASLEKNLGSVQIDWISLAAYNQFDPRKMPAAGTIIRVPAALLAQGTGPVATESIATTHAVPLNNLATNAITPRAKIRESDVSVQQSTTQAGPKSHKGHKDRKLGAWSYADSTTHNFPPPISNCFQRQLMKPRVLIIRPLLQISQMSKPRRLRQALLVKLNAWQSDMTLPCWHRKTSG